MSGLENMAEKKNLEELPDPVGWDAITAAFEKLYPGQEEPRHFATLIPWRLGGNDPLQGVSAYDGGDFFHLVSYGLSDLYEKEGADPDYSGYGLEFTMKLRKAGMGDESSELKCAAGIFNALARLTFEKGEQFFPDEYIYTGQEQGVDFNQRSRLTGFVTALDQAGIRLYPGVTGEADQAVAQLLAGQLRYDPDTTCQHHHHGDGHSCGEHPQD